MNSELSNQCKHCGDNYSRNSQWRENQQNVCPKCWQRSTSLYGPQHDHLKCLITQEVYNRRGDLVEAFRRYPQISYAELQEYQHQSTVKIALDFVDKAPFDKLRYIVVLGSHDYLWFEQHISIDWRLNCFAFTQQKMQKILSRFPVQPVMNEPLAPEIDEPKPMLPVDLTSSINDANKPFLQRYWKELTAIVVGVSLACSALFTYLP